MQEVFDQDGKKTEEVLWHEGRLIKDTQLKSNGSYEVTDGFWEGQGGGARFIKNYAADGTLIQNRELSPGSDVIRLSDGHASFKVEKTEFLPDLRKYTLTDEKTGQHCVRVVNESQELKSHTCDPLPTDAQ